MTIQRTFRPASDDPEEFLHINRSKKSIKAVLKVLTIKDRKFFVSLIPSLSISGYGKDKASSIEMVKTGLDDYCSALLKQKQEMIDADLSNHGWSKKSKLMKKKFTGPYIDKKGILQAFDLPEDTNVEEETLELH